MKLELKNVEKKFKVNNEYRKALDNINLSFETNGLYLIFGNSGSGKTTLLNLIAGYDSVTSGEIINDFGDNSSSVIFQDFKLIEYFNVYENLKFICDIYNIDYGLIDIYIKKYGLENILYQYPNEISGGEHQRVAIIRALLINHPIILCDEPTGSLDEENAIIIRDALREISEDHIVIVVSHDIELFKECCDEIIHLSKGKVIDITKYNKKNQLCLHEIKKPTIILKNQFFLMSKFVSKNKFKHILLFISMILTFTLTLISLTILCNSYNKVLYKTCKSENVSQVDFYLQGKNNSKINQTYEMLLNESKKYDANAIYYDNNILRIANLSSTRTYISNSTSYKMISGKQDVSFNEIVISDYVALFTGHSCYDVLYEIDGLTVVGVYNTGFYDKYKDLSSDSVINLNLDDDLIKKQYSSICINKTTFEGVISKSSEFEATVRVSAYSNLTHIKKEYDGNVLYGKLEVLSDNEVGMSKELALEYSEELNLEVIDLIDKNIVVKFALNSNPLLERKYADVSYKIKYIYDDGASKSMVLSDLAYNNASLSYNYDLINNTNGISIYNYNNNKIRNLLNNDYIDDISISNKINIVYDWIIPLKYILLGISVIMLFITIIILINFIHIIFEKEKSLQGILISFGLDKKKVIKMYFFNVLFIILLALIISIFIEFPIIYLINLLLIRYLNSMGIIYFSFVSKLCVILILALLMLLIYRIIYKNIQKKEVIDLIYER